MSLTKNDLTAIKDIVDESNGGLTIQVANGFDEVHKKIDKLDAKVHKIGSTQDKILDTLLPYDVRFKRLRDVIKSK